MGKHSARAAASAALLFTSSLLAIPVADYRDDFQAGNPSPGWSYLWNAGGALESSAGVLNIAGLVPLVADTNLGGDYETQANGTRPDAAPGSNLAATSTAMIPGQGSGQASDGFERFVVAAYTISAADIVAAGGGSAILDDYTFQVPFDQNADGVSSRIYVNNAITFPGETILPPGIDFNSGSQGAFPVPLGNLQAGDTVYVAIGSRASDLLDQLNVDYSIVLVPEPGAVAAIGCTIVAGVVRRRRRR